MPKHGSILMTADTVGGVWTYALELTRTLAAHDTQVFLATMGGPLSRAQAHEAGAISNLEVFESQYKLEWMSEPWEDTRAAGEWLLELESYLHPDIIHLNGYCHGALAWEAPVLIAGHSCVWSWWEAVKGEPAPPQWNRYRSRVRTGLQGGDLVVAPTRAMLSALERWYGPLPAARVIPNGRSRQGLSPGIKEDFVLSAGRVWDEAKNVAVLTGVAVYLPWPVMIAGDRRHPDGRTAPLRGAHSLGHLSAEELAPWFSRAAIYALPARYEPFGLSVLEAALAGCALVLGDIASLRENWEDAALFVPPDDPEALRTALLALINQPERRGELARRAREVALAFTPQAMADGYLAAYAELLSLDQKSRPELTLCGS